MDLNKTFIKAYITKSSKFFFVGGTGSLIGIGLLYVFVHYFGMWYITADVLAIAISAAWNFNLNVLLKVIKVKS